MERENTKRSCRLGRAQAKLNAIVILLGFVPPPNLQKTGYLTAFDR